MDITEIITILGIVQGVFILILIAINKNKNKQSKYILALLVVFIMDLASFYIIRSGMISQLDYLIGLGESTLFLYGPILYLYVSSVLDHKKISWFSKSLHFLPAIVAYLLISPLFFAEQTFQQFSNWEKQFPPLIGDYSFGNLLFDHVVWYTFSLVYFLFCLRLLVSNRKKYNIDISNSNRRIKRLHLKWVEYLILGYLSFPAIGLIVLIYNLLSDGSADAFSIINFFMVFHVFSISYIGFTNQELLTNPVGMFKYKQSKMDSDVQTKLIEKLKEYFDNQKPYLNQELTLKMVASDLNLSPHHISQVINDQYGHGFNDFVNHYRIELAKKFILAPEKQIFTLEAIASEVGFRSKPTFNSAFKKKEGITPSEYRKSVEVTM